MTEAKKSPTDVTPSPTPLSCRRVRRARGPAPSAALFLALPLAISACAQEIVTADSGTGGADATTAADATVTPDGGLAGDAEPQADAGMPEADAAVHPDATAVDTGVADAGGTPELTWGQMTLPSNSNIITAIYGRSATEIYVGTGNGKLLSLIPNVGWTEVWHSPSNFGVRSIWASASRLYVADETTLFVFTLGFANPSAHPVGSFINQIRGYDNAGTDNVFIVSEQQNGRGLYKFDGSAVRTLVEPPDIATLASLAVGPTGSVLVGANGGLYTYSNLTLRPEFINWPPEITDPEKTLITFTALGTVGATEFAGANRNLIFKNAIGGWTGDYLPYRAGGELHRIIGFDRGGDPEGYAVGDSTSESSILRYYKGQWGSTSYTGDVDLKDMWAVGPDDYYAVGAVANTFDGIILHGTR